MFGRKKVRIEEMKKRLENLEEKGYTELNAMELHDMVYHNFKPPSKWQFALYLAVPIVLFGILLVLDKFL